MNPPGGSRGNGHLWAGMGDPSLRDAPPLYSPIETGLAASVREIRRPFRGWTRGRAPLPPFSSTARTPQKYRALADAAQTPESPPPPIFSGTPPPAPPPASDRATPIPGFSAIKFTFRPHPAHQLHHLARLLRSIVHARRAAHIQMSSAPASAAEIPAPPSSAPQDSTCGSAASPRCATRHSIHSAKSPASAALPPCPKS